MTERKRTTRTPRPRNQAKPTPAPAAAAPMTDLLIAAHTADTFRLLDTARTTTAADQTTWRIAADHATVNAHEDGVTALFTATEAIHLGTAGAFDAALVSIAPILPGVLPHYVRLAKGMVRLPSGLPSGLGGHDGATLRLPRALAPPPPADPFDPGLVDPHALTGELPVIDAELVDTQTGMRPAYQLPASSDYFAPDGGDRG